MAIERQNIKQQNKDLQAKLDEIREHIKDGRSNAYDILQILDKKEVE